MQSRTTALCRLGALLLIGGVTACGVDRQQAPSLTGPSGLAQSMILSATPDQLPHDGRSQAVVTISMFNESGQPLTGQRVTVGASAGSVSQGDVVTGSDGRAAFVFTAPPLSVPANSVDVFATPIGSNAGNAVTRELKISLTGPLNATAPSPRFTFSPATPEVEQTVIFDASTTTDEGAVCNTCSFSWSFGDGSFATGRIAEHVFGTANNYTVTLTAVDVTGSAASTHQIVAVSALAATPDAPVARFTVSPSQPHVGEQVTFDARSSTPGLRAVIVRYDWTFGDGTSDSTTAPTISRSYDEDRTYAVVLTVTDNLGQTSTVGQQLVVLP